MIFLITGKAAVKINTKVKVKVNCQVNVNTMVRIIGKGHAPVQVKTIVKALVKV